MKVKTWKILLTSDNDDKSNDEASLAVDEPKHHKNAKMVCD